MSEHYQVIIVGGRPAGAGLAMWLGQHNIKTLLVDKSNFPSLPFVPSSPMIHNGTMSLLDELGVAESEYANPHAKISHYVMNFLGSFQAFVPVGAASLKRDYCVGLDRNVFDTVLWQHAEAYESVNARQGFSVTSILKDEQGKVTGVTGHTGKNTPVEIFTADVVVGADGRFSTCARYFGAELVEEAVQEATNTYQAEWENVEPIDAEHPHAVGFYNDGKGFAFIMVPIAERKYIVATYMKSSRITSETSIEALYQEALRSTPDVWRRLANAQQVTKMVGMREIRNGYRQSSGSGWALIGDALHYKDPIDGQGIYDALTGAKHLGEEIRAWQAGEKSWDEAAAAYHKKFMADTHPMYLQTTARLKREVLADTPPFIAKTMIRWMLTSPEYQSRFMLYLNRAVDPNKWMSGGVMVRAILRGIANDLFRRQAAPTPVQPRSQIKAKYQTQH